MGVLTKLVVAPVDMKMSVDKDFVGYFRNYISKETPNIPFKKGHIITLFMLGHKVNFKVVEIEPSSGVLRNETELEILDEPIREPLERVRSQITYPYPTEFIAKVISGGRITIPEEYRELHNIEPGCILAISFNVIKTYNQDKK